MINQENKTPKLNRELYAARYVVKGGTEVLMRTHAVREKVKANTNTIKAPLVMGSLYTMPMMRGVSCELASCIATNIAEETKTMKENIEAAIVPGTARAVSTSMADCQPIVLSIALSR